MSRTHVQLMNGEIGPGGTDAYTVPVGAKVLVSSMVLSADTAGVNCAFVLWLYPLGGTGVRIIYGTIGNDADQPNPYPAREPWIVLMATDQIEIENVTSFGGPNLSYSFSGILFDPP